MAKASLLAARADLRAAIMKRAEAHKRDELAALAVRHGQALVQDAKATVAASADADRKTAVERAERIKRALQNSAKSISNAALGMRDTGRLSAEFNLESAEETFSVLMSERQAAAQALMAADDGVGEAAEKVITIEAEEYAAELIAVNERGAELRHLLMGLSYVTRGYGHASHQPWHFTPKLYAAVHWIEPQFPGNLDPVKIAARNYRAYRDELTKNAEAKLNADDTASSRSNTGMAA